MSSIPSNLGRVPTLLASQFMLTSINTTQQQLLQNQIQLSTGKQLNRPSDDAVGTSLVGYLDDVLERRDQRLRNLDHAESVLGNVDAALGDASDLVLEAKEVGLGQIGVGSDSATRKSQAKIIDAILSQMISVANRQYQDIHFFGGEQTANPPLVELHGKLQYTGQGDGLRTDLGQPNAGSAAGMRGIPITVAGTDAFGAMSARVQGDRDLDPTMAGATRLADLRGALGGGITPGAFTVNVNGVDVDVDVTGAHTVQDVINALQDAIQTEDPGATVQIDPASENRLQITPSAGVSVTVSDLGGEGIAAQLGLTDVDFDGPAGATGRDLDPTLTEHTRLEHLSGVDYPLGTIRISNAGQTREVDLSDAQTVRDMINAVDGLNLGVRVEIAAEGPPSGDRLNFVNELSGAQMSVAEVGGGATATQLGVRSLSGSTLLSDFNNGLGVEILSGATDPLTGAPDPSRDLDFSVTTKSGVSFDVDLAGAQTVQDVLALVNQAADDAGLVIGTDFEAGLAADGNGIALTDNTPPAGGTTTVAALNGSFAAENLGILGSTDSAVLAGEDRATVAVDSVFSHLMELRDALLEDDTRGISLATSKLEVDFDRLTEVRADVGVRVRRVVDATTREGDLKIQDQAMKSQVQDLDFTEAAMRFANLQQQLQATLASASRVNSLSLLDFLR